MRIDLLTALPDLVRSPLEHSILQRAQTKGLVEIGVHDVREHAVGKHRKIDDYPFGGGGGMVMKPEPLAAWIEELQGEVAEQSGAGGYDEVIFLTPDGEPLTQRLANRLSMKGSLLLIAGHYKGIDERIRERYVTREVSVGDYVLSGGELPALTLIDAVVRLVPGVLGDAQSALTDSFQDGLLGAPVYTRPAEWDGLPIPGVLLSGDHDKIEAWRDDQRRTRTAARRPDLLGEDLLGRDAADGERAPRSAENEDSTDTPSR